MMKARISLVAVVILAASLPAAAFGRAMTLSEALDLAGGESPQVLAKEAAADAAASGVTRAVSAMTPELRVSEHFVRTDDPVGVFAAKLDQGKFAASDFAVDRLNHPKSVNNWITRFELGVPIFQSGTDWAQLQAAREMRSGGERLVDFERARVRLAVTRLYYTSVALSQQKRAIEEGIGKLRQLESSYQLMEAPTSASTTSFLVARSVRTGLEAEAVKVDCQRTDAERDLNAILGIEPDEPLTLPDPLPPVAGIEAGEQGAAARRADLEASAASVRAAAAERDAAMRRWGPDVHFVGAYNLYTGDFQDVEGAYEVGARLSWPVFALGRHARIGSAKARLAEAQHLHRSAELTAAADLQSAESNVRSCLQRYRIISQALSTASQALSEAAVRYQEGSLPLMDYSQTIQNWVRMRLSLIENHLSVATAKAEYHFQRGAL